MPSSQYARELIDEGEIGRPRSVVDSAFVNVIGYYANPGASPRKISWFSSQDQAGGFLLAAAPHAYDRLRWLFGVVQSVTGNVQTAEPEVALSDGRVIQVEVADAGHAIVRFASGVVALDQIVPAAWPRTTLRLEVHGSHGALCVEWIAGKETVKLARGSDAAYTDVPIPPRLIDSSESARVGGFVYPVADRLVRAILNAEPMSPTFEDAYLAQELIEAVLRSDETGQTQSLPLDHAMAV